MVDPIATAKAVAVGAAYDLDSVEQGELSGLEILSKDASGVWGRVGTNVYYLRFDELAAAKPAKGAA